MKLIVTVDENWAIGKGDLRLLKLPADHRNFMSLTADGIVVMGRRTLEALPQGQPLYGRKNIVLTSKKGLRAGDAAIAASPEELDEMLAGEDSDRIFICGGKSLYDRMLPKCDTVYVTYVEKSYDADVYFPNLDEEDAFELAWESDEQSYFDITYYFRRYERKNGDIRS